MKQLASAALLAFAIVGTLISSEVSAEDTPVLPRSFHKAHLGMGIADLQGSHPGQTRVGSSHPQSTVHVVDRPNDPYVKRVHYDFYKGRLAEITIMYNSDRLRGKIEPFVDRLKQAYGNPQATEGPQLAVTDDVYAEKKTHWSDSQTHVTLIERTGHEDDVPQVELVLSDLALSRERESAMKRQKEEDASKIPIPVPSTPDVRHRTAVDGSRNLTAREAVDIPSMPSRHSG